ncbi:MAG: virginiamycin B lyase family protein, partial [Ktedonobacterales bacterium]
ITTGPDGALWYTESGDQVVTRATTAGAFQRFEAEPSTHDVLSCDYIAAGPDGNLWYAETPYFARDGYHIARITPSGTITRFSVPQYADVIAAGPGGYLWYTEAQANKIGILAP